MDIGRFDSIKLVNLMYKVLLNLECYYAKDIQKGRRQPTFDMMTEEELAASILNFENRKDLFLIACRENTDKEVIEKEMQDTYFAFYDVLRYYEKLLPEKIANLHSRFYLHSKEVKKGNFSYRNEMLYVEDSVFEFYNKQRPITDRQYYYQVLGNRLLIALNRPNLLGLDLQTKYEMGKYYYLNQKSKDGFHYTVEGFVANEQHLNKLRDIVMKKDELQKEDEERDDR